MHNRANATKFVWSWSSRTSLLAILLVAGLLTSPAGLDDFESPAPALGFGQGAARVLLSELASPVSRGVDSRLAIPQGHLRGQCYSKTELLQEQRLHVEAGQHAELVMHR